MGLIRPSQRYAGNRVHEITEITGGAKELAREYGIAVVLLSQLNRALETRDNKRPQLSDLRDSGSIEQDADTVAFLYRDAYYLEREKGKSQEAEQDRLDRLIEHQNKLEFIIAKQRNGPLTTIDLFADMACGAIRNGVRHG
jgi:replicative DNA helicase